MKLFSQKSLENLLKLDIVDCYECGTLLKKDKAQEILVFWWDDKPGRREGKRYFCEKHRKKYNSVRLDRICMHDRETYLRVIPERTITVDENGKKKKIIY